MGMLPDLLGYLESGILCLMALAVLGVGLGLVRPVNAGAGYALAAAGAVLLLSTCCLQASSVAIDSVGSEVIVPLSTLVGIAQHAGFWGLLAFAGISVARAKGAAHV